MLTAFTVPDGFTVMLNVLDVPLQLKVSDMFVNTGVTVIVAVIGDAVVLVAVNAAILPVPLPARPIAVLSLNQL